jgi:aminoglycoside phosphotransferase (APT) family kinase protein
MLKDVKPLGSGLENSAYLVDDWLVVRFAHDDAIDVEREAAVLRLVGEVAPLPVPRPVFVEPGANCLGYEYLPGIPLLHVPAGDRARVAAPVARELGQLLKVLHSLDVGDLVDADDEPPGLWLADAKDRYATVADVIPAGLRSAVEGFLESAPPTPSDAHVFSHNDLGIEHVLVDPATMRITAVIDWTDAALTDPAYDFGLLLRDLGPQALRAALAVYGSSDALIERAWFYARCALLEDAAYGIETGREGHLTKGLDAIEWLFAPGRAAEG